MLFFKSAPSARIGLSAGGRMGKLATAPGAYPRERRRIDGPNAPTRATESSTRRAIGPFADEEGICNSREAVESILIFIRDGFARAVRARHDQNARSTGGKQKVLQWRVGKHDTDFPIVGSNTLELALGRCAKRWVGQSRSATLLPRERGRQGHAHRRGSEPSLRKAFPCEISARAWPRQRRRWSRRRPGDNPQVL